MLKKRGKTVPPEIEEEEKEPPKPKPIRAVYADTITQVRKKLHGKSHKKKKK